MEQQPTPQSGVAGEQYGQRMGGQSGQQGGQSQQFGQPGGRGGMDIKLEEGLTEEMRVVLHDLVQSLTACEWCAERCIDEGPEMAECLRLCRDVADLAALNVQLISRDSVFGPAAIEVFAEAAEACAQECARHGHRHCQECAEELSRAVQSTRKMLATFGQGGGQIGEVGMQSQGQPFQEAPGQQAQLPVQGGQQGQPFQQSQGGQQSGQGQPFQQSQGQQSGQHYAQGAQPEQGQQGPSTGQQF